VVKDAEKKAAEVKAAAAEKTVEVKAMAAAKAAEVKTVAAEKAVEVKAVAAAKAAEVKTVAAEKALTPAPAAGDAAAGAAIYKMKCSPCHGAEGKGTAMAPALKDNAWVKAASNADITGTIKNGRQGKAKKYANFFVDMPASKAMSEGDLSSLVAYLKSLN
ncbi:MAG: cytochrome c, partial [Deltaproteobacteria bacterium]|nr:cytochrome c [Deltaproteobacteria bacterium]